nr:unconventional myosin-X-like [Labrus bergylta]
MEVLKAAMIIQAHVMGYMARKQYRKLLQCIVVIQKNYRAFYWRRKFLLLRWAALTFQKRVRGQLARRAFSQLLEDRRRRMEEEERRRRKEEEEMERERQRLEAERLAAEAEEARRLEELASLALPPPPAPVEAVTSPVSMEEAELPEPLQEASDEEEEEAVRPQDASQVEEILRLEREIQVLQRQKERQELSLTEASLNRLQLLRDQELRRLEDEACKAAQQFLESLNFDEIDECVRNIESSLGVGEEDEEEEEAEKDVGRRRGNDEEEVDEGFGADDEAFKDSPNPSEHGHSDGQRTSGIRTSDDSSEEDPYANDGVTPPLPRPPTCCTSRCLYHRRPPPAIAPPPARTRPSATLRLHPRLSLTTWWS